MPELNDTNMFENLNLTQTYVREIIRAELGFNQVVKVELINKDLNISLKNGQSFTIPMEEPFINEYSSALMALVGNLNNNNITSAYVNSEGLLTVILDNGLKITSDFSYLNENINNITGNLEDLNTEVKTSLVASINEIINKTKDVITLFNKNVEAGANTKGWDTGLIIEGEFTQKQINESQKQINETQKQVNEVQKQINEVQKLKNKQLTTPFDFGAIGDGVYHKLSEKYTTLADAQVKYPTAQSLDDSIDLCALESFFDHCHANLVNANITLNAYVNRPLTLGIDRKTAAFKTKVYDGDLVLSNTQTTTEIPYLMRINANDTVWTGKITCNGTTGLVKDRKQLGGLVLGDGGTDGSAGRISINTVYCRGFKNFGFLLSNDSIFPRINNYHGEYIGAKGNAYTQNTNFCHVANILSHSLFEGQNNQYSTVTVDSLPSAFNEEMRHAMVMFEGDPLPYRIKEINLTDNTIKVYPRLNKNITYSKLSYIYGIGFYWLGNNSGVGNFGQIQCILCGIGFWGMSLYGANINSLSTEVCGVGLTLGNQAEVVIGYNINNSYFEGNLWDYVQQWNNSYSPLLNINMAHGLDFNRIAEIGSWRVWQWDEARNQDAFNASSFTLGNRTYKTDTTYSSSVDLSDPKDLINVINSGGDLLLRYSNKKINDMLKMNGKSIVIISNKESSKTPSAITIKVPDGWKLNGVLNGTLTTNPQKFATIITVVSDGEQSLRVYGESLYKTTGTTAERPSNAPTGFVYIDTTLNKPVYKTNSGWVDATGAVV